MRRHLLLAPLSAHRLVLHAPLEKKLQVLVRALLLCCCLLWYVYSSLHASVLAGCCSQAHRNATHVQSASTQHTLAQPRAQAARPATFPVLQAQAHARCALQRIISRCECMHCDVNACLLLLTLAHLYKLSLFVCNTACECSRAIIMFAVLVKHRA